MSENHSRANIGPATDPVKLRHGLGLIYTLHPVIEIRALKEQRRYGRPGNYGGFFDNVDDAARAVLALDPCKGIYWTLNAIPADFLAICANRLGEADDLTKNHHVVRRVLLLVDFDPKRPHIEISSNESEHRAAEQLACDVMENLRDEFSWPYPIMFLSGNGFGLWYRIDLPADDDGLVERVLKALSARFSTAAVQIDTVTANAARITKLPGTVARKGDHTALRPHRVAQIVSQVDSFDEVDVVSERLLREFANAFAPPAPPTPPRPARHIAHGGKSKLAACIKYLSKLPDSIEGTNGSGQLIHACCVCHCFDLTDAEAWEAIGIYNTEKCKPAWSEKELRHKLADAAKKVDGEGKRGSMGLSKKDRVISDAIRFALESVNV